MSLSRGCAPCAGRRGVVDLPDFDEGVADGLPGRRQDAPVRCVISPMAGVIASLMMSRSLSVSSGSLSG